MLRLKSEWIRMLMITTMPMAFMGPIEFMVLARIMITVDMADATTVPR